MARTLILALAVVGLSCSISPVVTEPFDGGGNSRYSDCRRAARDYCSDVVGASGEESRSCVAKHTFECVSRP
jgi:hypothetical protein